MPNQDERIGYVSSLARYDRPAARLPNHKNGGRPYDDTGPSYIPTIARSQISRNEVRRVRPDQRLTSMSHRDGCHTGGSGVNER